MTRTDRNAWVAFAIAIVLAIAIVIVAGAITPNVTHPRALHPPHRERPTADATQDGNTPPDPLALLLEELAVPPTTTTTTSPPPPTTSPPAPAPVAHPIDNPDGFLACVRNRESGGDYTIHELSGASSAAGAYQFLPSTWDQTARDAGRPDLVGIDPAAASPADQDAMAEYLYATQGAAPWGGHCP
jgi:hypothetical protein